MIFCEIGLYITWTLMGLVSGYLVARFRNMIEYKESD